MTRLRLMLALVSLLVAVLPAYAATQNAVVYGTVYDSAGNPMPGVTVTLENPALGFSRTAETGSDGSYNFAEVPPADEYKLTAAKDGKTLDIRAGISVNVGDERVILPPLKEQAAAATGTKVKEQTVAGQAVTNETVSSSISGVITGDQLRSLPLYNRNFLVLGGLTPNVRDTEPGSELTGASFSIAGTRPSTNNFLLDGADNVASSSNQAVPFQVNEAIQEFRVTSSTANAEYGRNQGGVVSVVTRRGSNAFHGAAFGYFAADALNADSPISVYAGSTFDQNGAFAGSTSAAPVGPPFPGAAVSVLSYNAYAATAAANGFCTDSISLFTGVAGSVPCITGGTGENSRFDPQSILDSNNRFDRPYQSQQFGFNLGGPIAKDRLFGFLSYEGTRIDNPNPVFERVPTAFDHTYDPLGSGNFLFPSNDPNYVLSQDILNLFPEPNVVGVPGVMEFFRGEAPNYTNVHNILLRADYAQSQKDSWSFRYVVQKLDQLHDATLPPTANYPGNGAFRDALNQNLNISYSHTFSPSVINEIRLGFSRFNVKEKAQDRTLDATSLGIAGFNLPNSALPTILLNGLDTQSSGAVPGFSGVFSGWVDFLIFGGFISPIMPSVDNLFPFARLGAPLSAPSQRRDTTLFFADNVSYSFGKHSLKAGAEFRHLRNDFFNGVFSRGFMYSSNIGEFTSDSETCNEACAIFLGTPDAFTHPSFDFYQAQTEPYEGDFRSWALAGYFQDTWRLHPRVTLNLGLRYEYFSPPEEHGDRIFNFDPAADGLVQQNRSGPVTDAFGHVCDQTGTWTMDSIPVLEQQFLLGSSWNCQPSGSGRIVNSDRNNFAPRVGIAWDAFGDGKTIFRFGIGWFYDQLPITNVSQLMFNRPTSLAGNPNAVYGQIVDVGAGVCTSFQCGTGISMVNPAVQGALSLDGVNPASAFTVAAQPFAIYARDFTHSNTPYSRQMSATVQQAISNNLALEVGYVGTAGRKLPVVVNTNFNRQWDTANLFEDPHFLFPIYTMTNQAESDFHSLMVRVRAANWHGLRINANYNLANSQDNASSGFFPTLPVTAPNLTLGYQFQGQENLSVNCIYFLICNLNGAPTPLIFPSIDFSTGAVTTTGAGRVLVSRYQIPQDPFNALTNDLGRSDFHTKHRLVLDYTWDVPAFSKAWGWPTWLDHWQMSGIFVAQSGQPFTIFSGPVLGEVTQRANLLGPVSVSDDPTGAITPVNNLQLPATGACFDPSFPFASPFLPIPPDGACKGNSARNQFTGPNFINLDFAVQKGFPIGEGKILNFRAEFYNLTNRNNFFNPISQLSLDGFNINPAFGQIKSAHNPRQIQFAVRFAW